jgi:hypothetical protein
MLFGERRTMGDRLAGQSARKKLFPQLITVSLARLHLSQLEVTAALPSYFFQQRTFRAPHGTNEY